MHFLLLGATGRTGKHVVREVLAQGHTAVALVRTPSALEAQPGLTIVQGSSLSRPDIKKALAAAPTVTVEAAIFTLNASRKSDNPFASPLAPPRFLAGSCANACAVLEEAGIHRIVIMSSVGVGDSWANLPLVSKAFLGLTNIKYALKDHDLMDKEIRATDMEWTLVRAPRLEYDDRGSSSKLDSKQDVQTLSSSGVGMAMSDSIHVASVARFLVKIAVEKLHIKEAVVIRE